mmetsp:Transcript_29378/g.73344  ORF Transcript_29378/g.73344 Transcript_29378/m.73344 type:complete len:274 (-) Transcript_29378:123-944(-)
MTCPTSWLPRRGVTGRRRNLRGLPGREVMSPAANAASTSTADAIACNTAAAAPLALSPCACNARALAQGCNSRARGPSMASSASADAVEGCGGVEVNPPHAWRSISTACSNAPMRHAATIWSATATTHTKTGTSHRTAELAPRDTRDRRRIAPHSAAGLAALSAVATVVAIAVVAAARTYSIDARASCSSAQQGRVSPVVRVSSPPPFPPPALAESTTSTSEEPNAWPRGPGADGIVRCGKWLLGGGCLKLRCTTCEACWASVVWWWQLPRSR